MKTFEDVPKKYIVKMQGREYITHDGLMWLANEKGGIARMWTEISPKGDGYLAKAFILPEIDTKNIVPLSSDAQVEYLKIMSQPYVAHAIADKSNVNRMVSTAMERMAETRAMNRVLRMFLRSGEVTYEELPVAEIDDEPMTPPKLKGGKPSDKTSEIVEPPKQEAGTFPGFETADKIHDGLTPEQRQMLVIEIGKLRTFSPLCEYNTKRALEESDRGLVSELSDEALDNLHRILKGCQELGADAEPAV